jgi:opacity protein-like surface antigen
VAQKRQPTIRGSCILLTLEVGRITRVVECRFKTKGAVMMKFLLGTTMFAGLMVAGAAQAADMPLKAPPRPVIYSDWTGFYMGIHAGYGWGRINPDDGDFTSPFHNPHPKGGVFGGQAGYNWQYGRAVVGLEIDYTGAGLKENQNVNFKLCQIEFFLAEVPAECTNLGVGVHSKIDALASARARAGFLLTDNWLAYGTAGIGWGRSELSIPITINNVPFVTFSSKEDQFGWVAGGGLEYKFAEHWLLRGEYLHYGFGSITYSFQPIGAINAKTSVDVARAALSYKF